MNSSMSMSFTAVVAYAGEDSDGIEQYEIQLMVNHHVVYRWSIDLDDEYAIRARPGLLEQLVSARIYKVLHGGR